METKHTKGEWDYEDLTVFPKGLSSNIAKVQFRTNNEETEANAKLIAAAPELLEALIDIIKTGGNIAVNDKEWIDAINAINKATK